MNDAGIIATDDLPNAGALVYWRLEGELIPVSLAIPWAAAGLAEALLPQTPAPSTALSRAMRELTSKRRMVRPLDRRGAHALVDEKAANGGLTHRIELRVELDPAGRPVFSPPDHPLAQGVRTDYLKHLEECSTDDVGAWLCRLIRRFDGLALRDTGGFYYVPPHRLAEWDRVVDCLREVSGHRVFKIPALRSQDALEAILDAIDQEASAEAAKMEDEIVNGVNGKPLGERALGSRFKHCEGVEQKVVRYEELLGMKLDSLRARLEELRANLAAAAMKASMEEDAAAS